MQHNKSMDYMERIFLVGFMGSGKTHWGKIWADKINFSFIDLDEVIEQEEHCSIAQIFEKKGEDYFREKEAAALRLMKLQKKAIIACGGGTPCFFENMQWMNENGTTVLLEADAAYILKNIERQPGQRPLIKGMNIAEKLLFIEKKLKDRELFYSEASIQVDAETADENAIDHIKIKINHA